MENFNKEILKQLYVPASASHKGQNGKLMIIGGSRLFHSASLWSLQIASKVVDMVFYSSVEENNSLVHELKKEFRGGIVVPRGEMEAYIEEADAVLIGPGMLRSEKELKTENEKLKTIEDINTLEDEGEQSYYLTKYLLAKYPEKQWVIDAGALQMLEPEWLLPLIKRPILTPHLQELDRVFSGITEEKVGEMAKQFNCVILLKGEKDLVCSPDKCVAVPGGNAGMTKGGTGDVLAGLVAALVCKNEPFLAAVAGSYINKKAGEALFERVGYYFNASELANEIPRVMKQLLF